MSNHCVTESLKDRREVADAAYCAFSAQRHSNIVGTGDADFEIIGLKHAHAG